MRILFVCQGDLRNASTKQALAFAEGLVQSGHSVSVSMHGDPASVSREGFVPRDGLEILFRRELLWRLSAADTGHARDFAPDILHVFNPRHQTVNAARQFLRATAATVVVHWEDDELGIREGVVARTLWRRVGRRARRVLCYPIPAQGVFVTRTSLRWVRKHAALCDALTPELADSVEAEMGIPCVTVLPTMLDVESPSDESPFERLPAVVRRAHKITYTGSVHTESVDDFRLAICAVADLLRRGHDVVFVYAGVALSRFSLEAIARDEGLDGERAISLGYLPFAKVHRVLAESSVLVQPGRPVRFNRLRLPSKVQAYLASGTPTVMFSVGLGELLKDRVEVLKLMRFDSGELADRIEELLLDETLADRIGEGGRSAARRLFNTDRNVQSLVLSYKLALTNAGRT